ncbi:MAG: GNAT family N-acetyltransferase [Bacteroidales bacterium]|nr:GNAT family N-acetyltransferase [Bacteroidales bacterium]
MKIKEATLEDIDLLIRIRLDFIVMIGFELSDEQEQTLRAQLDKYYRKHIPLGDFIAFYAEDERQVVAAAFMVIGERPAGILFPSGIAATLLNVITYPEYRKKGYATSVIQSLIRKAKKLNVEMVDLQATQMGKKVYQDLGFESVKDTAMRLKL